jgi:hypothetical protein
MLSRRFSRLRGKLRITALSAAVLPLAAASALVSERGRAEDGATDHAELGERCGVRLSIALLGKSPDAALLASADPQGAVDAMVATPEFADRFARFVNARFNGGPSDDATNDPVYYLARYVVGQNQPWSELFLGPYDVVANDATGAMDVKTDPNGLGYFRTDAWRKRYAGNEPNGYMLSAAFRILSNTTGLELTPSVGNPGDDRTATGRSQGVCKSCHFDAWYALDTFARLLPMRKGQGNAMTFTPPTAGPQQLLGKTLATDKDLVSALVDSDAWRFAQCRDVFLFLYGRAENQCEAKVFDACVDALSTQKTIRAAVSAVAKDPSFCQ